VASWITVPVERRVLASTVVSRGDVRPLESLRVDAPSSIEGSAVVTGVFVGQGDEVVEGVRVVEVSGRPVFILQGEVPVFRSLKPGMQGADVRQLQDALVRLGYRPEVDGVFGSATKDAVAAFYVTAGYEPVATSPTAAADVAAARQALQDAEASVRLAEVELANASEGSPASQVAAAEAAVNAAVRDVESSIAVLDVQARDATIARDNAVAAYNRVVGDPASTPADVEAALAAKVAAEGALDTVVRDGENAVASAQEQLWVAQLALNEAREQGGSSAAVVARDNAISARDAAAVTLQTVIAENGPTVAQGEVVFVPTVPARVQSVVAGLGPVDTGAGVDGLDGGGGGAGSAGLVVLSAGGLVVSTTVRAGDEGLVRVGMEVSLLDETTNVAYPATFTSIAEEATLDGAGQLGRAGVITPVEPLPDSLAGVNVRVTITAAASDGEVLVVPLAAVSSAADGSTRVSVLGAGSDVPVDVAVTAGISADGFVAVEPVTAGALDAGDLVVVGR
jgi:hypothetical protein